MLPKSPTLLGEMWTSSFNLLILLKKQRNVKGKVRPLFLFAFADFAKKLLSEKNLSVTSVNLNSKEQYLSHLSLLFNFFIQVTACGNVKGSLETYPLYWSLTKPNFFSSLPISSQADLEFFIKRAISPSPLFLRRILWYMQE